MKKDALDPYVQLAHEGGAEWAGVMAASGVVTAPWVRFKCRFGCDFYNEKRYCPPRTPTPQETADVVHCYKRAIIAVWDTLPGTRERRGKRRRMQKHLLEIERRLFLDGHYKALAFGAGPCQLCSDCDVNQPCKHPGDPRPSMEACGMDVYATLANAGYKLRVVTDPKQHNKMCGLVLVD
jgi:predicted metal-binding protein